MAGISQATTDHGSLNYLIKEKLERLQPIPREALKALFPESVSNTGLTVAKANHLSAEEIPNEFLELCRFILQKIKLWDGECCDKIVDKNLMKEVEEVLQGNLTISFVGGYNKGKSTLLNALLGDDTLPTSKESETAVKVYIQHKEDCHEGRCSKGGNCEKCPTMCESLGRSQIKEKLHSLNSERVQREEKRIVLHANVPVLGSLTKGTQMKISLVDIPGMGVTDEALSKMATECTQSSCAYVYVVDYQYLEDAKDSENLKMLCEKGMKPCHLIVAVNMFDKCYEEESNFEDEIAHKKERVCQILSKVLPWELSRDSVVPVSGKLALQAALYDSLTQKERNRLAYMAKCIEQVVDIPCGEGEGSPPVPTVLREGSNIEELSTRIEKMSHHLSIGWVSELKTRVMVLLQELQEWYLMVNKRWTTGLSELQAMFKEYNKRRQQLKTARKKLQRDVKEELESAFVTDLNVDGVKPNRKIKQLLMRKGKAKSNGFFNYELSAALKELIISIAKDVGDAYKQRIYLRISETYHKFIIELRKDNAELERRVEAFCNLSINSYTFKDTRAVAATVEDDMLSLQSMPSPDFLSIMGKAGFPLDKPSLLKRIMISLKYFLGILNKRKHNTEQQETGIPDTQSQNDGQQDAGQQKHEEADVPGPPNQQEDPPEIQPPLGLKVDSNVDGDDLDFISLLEVDDDLKSLCESYIIVESDNAEDDATSSSPATPTAVDYTYLSAEEVDDALNGVERDLLEHCDHYADKIVKQNVVDHYWCLYNKEVKACLKSSFNPYEAAINKRKKELIEMKQMLDVVEGQLKEIKLRIQDIDTLRAAVSSAASATVN